MKKLHYRIYAISADDKAYVGKTTAQRLEPILWRHQRGDIAHTRDHYKRGISNPRIVVLEEIQSDVHTAYRHTIAFIRMFMGDGYKILNSPGMIEDAMDIHALTQAILDDLSHIPLTVRISQESDVTEVPPPESTGTGNPPPRKHAPPRDDRATAKLAIHLSPAERERFIELTRATGVTQRQCLMLMIENAQNDDLLDPDWSANEYVSLMLGVYKEEIAKLEEQVQKLEAELHAQNAEDRKRNKKRDTSLQQSFFDYFAYYKPESPNSAPLTQGLYTDYLSSTPPEQRHKYPATEDTFVFLPESIFLGKGKYAPLFIVGRDSYHQKILLRFYPKQHWFGLRFNDKIFGQQHSQWLVRCERAKDGAMDVVFSLPLDIVPRCGNTTSVSAAASSVAPDDVDALIHEAMMRSKDDCD